MYVEMFEVFLLEILLYIEEKEIHQFSGSKYASATREKECVLTNALLLGCPKSRNG